MSLTITIELPEETMAELDAAVQKEGVSPDKFMVAALQDYLFVRRFRNLRERMKAQATESYTDQDIFDCIS